MSTPTFYADRSAVTYKSRKLSSALLLLTVFITVLFGGLSTMIASQQIQDTKATVASAQEEDPKSFDISRWIMCRWGAKSYAGVIYQALVGNDIEYFLFSKSAVSSGGNDVEMGPMGLNWMLDITGKSKFKTVNEEILGRPLVAELGANATANATNGATSTAGPSGSPSGSPSVKATTSPSGGARNASPVPTNTSTPSPSGSPSPTGTATPSPTESNPNYNKGPRVNPFDRFGVAGLSFTGYLGEWNYVKIDACATKPESKDSGTSIFYQGRQAPQSIWEDREKSIDVRTQQHKKGVFNHYIMAFLMLCANMIFFFAKFVVVVAISLVGFAFSDIMSVIGMTDYLAGPRADPNSGVIGRLFTGIFQPLIIMAFLVVAISMLWQGIVKKKYRNALGLLIRSIAIYLLALAISTNPAFWVALPNGLATLLQTAVISSLTYSPAGGNGLCDTDVGNMKTAVLGGSEAAAKPNALESASTNIRSVIGCVYWQEFLFRPWAQGQFGSEWNAAWAKGKAPSWAEKSTVSSFNNTDGNADVVGDAAVPMGNGEIINNWALFHLSTQTNVHAPIGTSGKAQPYTSGLAGDWWRIVDVIANYEEEEKTIAAPAAGSGSDGGYTGADSNVPAATTLPPGGPPGGATGAVAKVPPHNLKPWTIAVGKWIADNWKGTILSIGGWRQDGSYGDHPSGEAIDVMFSKFGVKASGKGYEAGTALAQYLCNNAAAAGTKTIIWYGKIWNSTKDKACKPFPEWRTYQGYGGVASQNITTGHFDHVHFRGVDGAAAGIPPTNFDGGSAPAEDVKIMVPKINPVLPEWDTWTGNSPGARFGAAFTASVVAVIGTAPTLFFALLSSLYAFGVALITAFAPVFLLLGVTSNKGWEILKSYAELLLNTILRRVAVGLLLVLSLMFTSVAIGIMEKESWWEGAILMVLLAYVLISSRQKIIDAVASIRFASYNMTDKANSIGRQGIDTAKFVGRTATSSTISGASSKRAGGSFFSGAVRGAKHELRGASYRNPILREAFNTAESLNSKKNPAAPGMVANMMCMSCHDPLNSGSVVYYANGRYLCENCADREGGSNVYSQIDISTWDETTEAREDDKVHYLKSQFTHKEVRERTNEILDTRVSVKERKQKVQDLGTTIGYEIASVKRQRSMHKNVIFPKTPSQITPYVDVANIERAWKQGDFDYIKHTYALAWSSWVAENGDDDLVDSMDDLAQSLVEAADNATGEPDSNADA